MNDTLITLLHRRSIRKYQATQISREDCLHIVDAGLYAPSSRNGQPWHILVVRGTRAIDSVTAELKAATARMAENPYKAFVGAAGYTVNYHAPTFIIVSANPVTTTAPEADCAVVLENMFLAARSLGIGSCWINQLNPASGDPGFRTFLANMGMPEANRIYGCGAFGLPDGPFPEAPTRKGRVSWAGDPD